MSRNLKPGGLRITITREMGMSRLTISISKPSQKALQTLKASNRDALVVKKWKRYSIKVRPPGKRLTTMKIPKNKSIKNIMKSNNNEVHLLLIMHHEMDQDRELILINSSTKKKVNSDVIAIRP